MFMYFASLYVFVKLKTMKMDSLCVYVAHTSQTHEIKSAKISTYKVFCEHP